MITIIIPVFNNLELTKNCVGSIYRNTGINDFKLIIVNNASSDGTAEYLEQLKKEKSNFSFISNKTNLGFSRANNQAAKVSETEKLLFLNNDTEVTPDWLTALNNGLEESGAKIAGAKLLYPDKTVQHAGIVFSKFANDYGQPLIYHIFRNFPACHPAVNTTRFRNAVTGACMLTYRDFYLTIGGFDEQYSNGFEDVDLCLKTIEHGGKIIYCPESTVYHYEGKTAGRHNKTAENTELFYSRWQNKLTPDDYLYYEQEGFILHQAKQCWNTVKVNEGFAVREEKLVILFERKTKEPVYTVMLKNKEPELLFDEIMSVQQLPEDFELVLIAGEVSGKSVETFTNVRFCSEDNFTLEVFKELLISSKTDKILFMETGDIFDRQYLIDRLDDFMNEKTGDYDDFINPGSYYFDSQPDFVFRKIKYLLKKNEAKKSLALISNYIKQYGSNKEITGLLILTLEKLGDFKTAEKLRAEFTDL